MRQNRMYEELAYLWPLISPPESYADEARCWRDALRAHLGPGRHEILELGVGGGHNLSHLTADFQATAVDISEKMLANSVALNPGVEHHVGDMRSVRLGRCFKAVIAHDAIDYMLTEADLRAAFATARAHLKPGGVFITSPDWFRETFDGTSVSHSIRRQGELELTFIEHQTDSDPSDTVMESVMFYVINKGGRLAVEQDLHITGLFPEATWLRLMDEAGFRVEKWPYSPRDDPRQSLLLIGVLPDSPAGD
jgi:SAM-dependent methyltransferase